MSSLRKAAKGSISELLVGIYYTEANWTVYYPHTHDTEIDMIVTKGPRIKRVQVKTVYDCGGLLRVNVHYSGNPKYSPDTVDIMACIWLTGAPRMWVIPMDEIEDETTLNFGRVDGSTSRTKGNFNHHKYEVIT